MKQATRDQFDQQLEAVLAELPPQVHAILQKVPLIVEDYPSEGLMREQKIRHRSDLMGFYCGDEGLAKLSYDGPPHLNDSVYLFRLGIMRMAEEIAGRQSNAELRNQIRITILHELGHHHGLDENDLEELGYG